MVCKREGCCRESGKPAIRAFPPACDEPPRSHARREDKFWVVFWSTWLGVMLAIAVAVLASTARGQSLEITAPVKVQAGTLVRVSVKAEGVSDKLPLVWEFPASELPGDGPDQPSVVFASAVEQTAKGRSLLFAWPKAGALTFKVSAFLAVKDGDEVVGFTPIFKQFTIEQTGGSIGPEPAAVIPRPAPPLDTAVAEVTRKLVGKPAVAQDLARFFLAVATNLERGACGSTGAVRQLMVRAGGLAFYGQLLAKTPGLAEEVNGVLAAQLGLDDAALDAPKRAQVVAVFMAIAWACAEAK